MPAVKAQAAVYRYTDEHEQTKLVQEITIECAECGAFTLRISGHHLRRVRAMLDETIATWPDLCPALTEVGRVVAPQADGWADEPGGTKES